MDNTSPLTTSTATESASPDTSEANDPDPRGEAVAYQLERELPNDPERRDQQRMPVVYRPSALRSPGSGPPGLSANEMQETPGGNQPSQSHFLHSSTPPRYRSAFEPPRESIAKYHTFQHSFPPGMYLPWADQPPFGEAHGAFYESSEGPYGAPSHAQPPVMYEHPSPPGYHGPHELPAWYSPRYERSDLYAHGLVTQSGAPRDGPSRPYSQQDSSRMPVYVGQSHSKPPPLHASMKSSPPRRSLMASRKPTVPSAEQFAAKKELEKKVQDMEDKRAEDVAHTEKMLKSVKPMKSGFHYFVSDMKDALQEDALKEIKSKGKVQDETKNTRYLLNSNVNCRLMRHWEDLLRGNGQSEYHEKEKADRKRFAEEDIVATSFCSMRTARSQSNKNHAEEDAPASGFGAIASVRDGGPPGKKLKSSPARTEEGAVASDPCPTMTRPPRKKFKSPAAKEQGRDDDGPETVAMALTTDHKCAKTGDYKEDGNERKSQTTKKRRKQATISV